MKPFPRDLEEVQIQPSKEIAVIQLESAKKFLSTTLEQMQPADHSVLFAFGVIINAIEHAIDVVNKQYEPATPTPEQIESVNRNWEKIQQWAKG